MNIMWKSEKRKLSDLVPADYNPRKINDSQALNLSRSLEKFSVADPIVINADNKIIGGHQRYYILKKQGIEEIDVRTPTRQLTVDEEKELNLRLNKNTGEWNNELLVDFGEDMLKNVGFSSEELDEIFKMNVEPKEKDDVVPEQRETNIKLGDMFQLGEHRLLCGDATKKEDVEKLMQGEKADMVFTDPPYGINLDGDNSKRGKSTSLMKGGLNLRSFKDDSIDYAVKAFNICDELNISRQVWWGANYYCHHLPMTNNWFVWDKRVEEKMKNTNSDCELAWVKSKWSSVRIFRHLWKGLFKASEKGERRVHPTQKPIELAIWSFNYFKQVKSVLDLFGGSGSTLIACEKTNRKCRMMEIDPSYCQLIIDRWEGYTNQKSTKVEK